jgi:hypothetical protein
VQVRKRVSQKLKVLCGQLDLLQEQARDIPRGPREALDVAEHNRIIVDCDITIGSVSVAAMPTSAHEMRDVDALRMSEDSALYNVLKYSGCLLPSCFLDEPYLRLHVSCNRRSVQPTPLSR